MAHGQIGRSYIDFTTSIVEAIYRFVIWPFDQNEWTFVHPPKILVYVSRFFFFKLGRETMGSNGTWGFFISLQIFLIHSRP